VTADGSDRADREHRDTVRRERDLLRHQLGLEPTATVARLEGAILRQEPELDWPPPDAAGRPSPVVPVPVAPAPEDRLGAGSATIMVTDVEASTGLRARHGDQVASATSHGTIEEMVRAQAEIHGGHGVTALGEGVVVAFTSDGAPARFAERTPLCR
jgi:hypothetical protein